MPRTETGIDLGRILGGLKDFQRETVEYVFRRLYCDHDQVRRFLVADEVGLGKTLVARGLIARAIEHLQRDRKRIDIIYVCSNADIARQNIDRLNVTRNRDFCLSSRITLLPLELQRMQERRINFISFTPGTTFDISRGVGKSQERELLYLLITNEHDFHKLKAARLLEGRVGTEAFRDRAKSFGDRNPSPHPQIAGEFSDRLKAHPDLLDRFERLCEAMPRANAAIPEEVDRERNQLVGELRRLLAEATLKWMKPDLIILDEFQRFKDLLTGDGDDASDAAQLAHHLFNYQQTHDDPSTGARVLLLSATPYKMYTLAQDSDEDDHYGDFERTLAFLMSAGDQQRTKKLITAFRQNLYRVVEPDTDDLLMVKRELEDALRKVMVRTERLATSADRNGMLEVRSGTKPQLAEGDVEDYLALQRIARSVDAGGVMDYWKSAPYLLNLMEDYDIKRFVSEKSRTAIQSPEFVQAMKEASHSLIPRNVLEKYRKLDPGNARLRALYEDTVQKGVWRLLWIPPSLPYYEPSGAFANANLAHFTKRLVFSCWKIVPKAIAVALSYEAEREMMHVYSKKIRNTPSSRKKRRALLRFSSSKRRATGMPVFGMIYPCQWLARRIDPLSLGRELQTGNGLASPTAIIQHLSTAIQNALAEPLATASRSAERIDEKWYWAAPLLLDNRDGRISPALRAWLNRDNLEHLGAGSDQSEDTASRKGWLRHLREARNVLDGSVELGPPPEDLCSTLAQLAIASPGVAALRALCRVIPGAAKSLSNPEAQIDTIEGADNEPEISVRSSAMLLANAFVRLFNLPEVMCLLRDRKKEIPYWKGVLRYCVDGNLQAVLDEYAHITVEQFSQVDATPEQLALRLSHLLRQALELRTSTAQVDIFNVAGRRVKLEESPLRVRTRFAMRFGDQESDGDGEPTRADHVRLAFNSPFWPFILATTSVGQEGLDFHPYCHAVMHWNLPSNPVDLEQREGRVHRYKGHAIRKNLAAKYGVEPVTAHADVWQTMFNQACRRRAAGRNEIEPFWITADSMFKIERHVPALPQSRELVLNQALVRSLVMYRMVFGQNRQEDLVRFLSEHLSQDRIQQITESCRLTLAPPPVIGETVSRESRGRNSVHAQ